MTLETYTYVITALAALVLIGAGVFLCVRRDPKAAVVTAVLSFGFLVLLLLNMSKFKHVNGFGFEAETWDEKQVQAAKLVEQLSGVTEVVSGQIALIATRLGVFAPALSNIELMDIINQTDHQLEVASVPKERRDKIIKPLQRRMVDEYWWAATTLIDQVYVTEHDKLESQNQLDKASQVQAERVVIDSFPTDTFFRAGSLKPALEMVRTSKLISAPESLLKKLDELDADVAFFVTKRALRRAIDLSKSYP